MECALAQFAHHPNPTKRLEYYRLILKNIVEDGISLSVDGRK